MLRQVVLAPDWGKQSLVNWWHNICVVCASIMSLIDSEYTASRTTSNTCRIRTAVPADVFFFKWTSCDGNRGRTFTVVSVTLINTGLCVLYWYACYAQDKFNDNKLVIIKVLHMHYSGLGGQEADCIRKLCVSDPYAFAPVVRVHVCRSVVLILLLALHCISEN